MKIQNRQQFLVALTIAAAALFVGVNWIYTPLANLWSARAQEIKALHAKVNNGNFLKKREADIRGLWDNMRTNALPANTSLAENQVITALNNWSRNSGADITSILPQWKNDSTNYWTLNCRVEATGSLGALSQFIYQVEKGPMPLKPDSVELSAHDATGQQLTLGLQISGLALISPTK